eukprot:TRINITY_DN54532_c0_g1_i1.p1 TRINITY_DN54532_c0_g1~~TRINITY_DN54532_c0_g1_i1.p1  ORF type:complete len:455 (-),score=69.86 TRINITY_DN54532_c0_g1_i1:14-1378(-)
MAVVKDTIPLRLIVTAFDGERLQEMSVARNTTGRQVKAAIASSVFGVPEREQRLLFGSQILEDDQYVGDLVRLDLGVAESVGVAVVDDNADVEIELCLVRAPKLGFVLSVSYDSKMRMWDLRDNVVVPTCDCKHFGPIRCVTVDWASKRVLTGSQDKSLVLWAIEADNSCKQLRTLRGQRGQIYCVAADWHAQRCICGSWDGSLQLWDLETQEQPVRFARHTGAIRSVAMDWSSRRAFSGGVDAYVQLWCLESCFCLALVRTQHTAVYCLAVDWGSSKLLTGGPPVTAPLALWTCGPTVTEPLAFLSVENEGVVAGNGAVVRESATADETAVAAKSTATGGEREMPLRFGNVFAVNGNVTVFCLDVDWELGRALTGGADGHFRLWDLVTGVSLREFDGHRGAIYSVVVDWTWCRAISGGEDCLLKTWDIEEGECQSILRGHSGAILGLATDWAL